MAHCYRLGTPLDSHSPIVDLSLGDVMTLSVVEVVIGRQADSLPILECLHSRKLSLSAYRARKWHDQSA